MMWKLLLALLLIPFASGSNYTSPTGNGVLLPALGNGNIGTIVDSGVLFHQGLFNGYKTADRHPTHKAALPVFLQVTKLVDIYGAALSVSGQQLDMKYGLFKRSYTGSNNVHATVTRLMHRSLPSASVLLVEGHNNEVKIVGAPALKGNDVNWQPVSLPSNIKFPPSVPKPQHIWCGETKEAELKMLDKSSVCLLSSGLPEKPVASFLGITVVKTATPSLPQVMAGDVFDALLQEAAVDYCNAYNQTSLLSSHKNAWLHVWGLSGQTGGGGGIEFHQSTASDDPAIPDLALTVNASLYALYSSISSVSDFSLSPGELGAQVYNSHVFWDAETWMAPPLSMFRPDLGKRMVDYRAKRLWGARAKATSYGKGYVGTEFPWESAYSGEETCPTFAGTGLREVHISSDVAFFAAQMYFLTGDTGYLRNLALPILDGVCTFWASRVSEYPAGVYHIDDVIPPDEYADHKNDSIYTNFAAARIFNITLSLGKSVGNWSQIRDGLVMLYDGDGNYHPEYLGYKRGTIIKQADVVLLGYPWDYPYENDLVKQNDLEYYSSVTDPKGPAMTWSMHTIGYLDIENYAEAGNYFFASYQKNVQLPYYVWTEVAGGHEGSVHFITGAGGFLQGILNGYAGLRVHGVGSPGRVIVNGRSYNGYLQFNPYCIPHPKDPSSSLGYTLRRLKYFGCEFDLVVVCPTGRKQRPESFVLHTYSCSSTSVAFASGTDVVILRNGTDVKHTFDDRWPYHLVPLIH